MKKTLVVALALSLSSFAFAGDTKADGTTASKQSFKMVTIPELAQLQKDHKVSVYDANGPETRTKYGVIPGATLLTSMKYDTKILPASKTDKLVFYCANTQCGASHQAAERAVGAGYTDVAVLPDGIMGWQKSGQKTDTVPRS